MPFLNPSGVCSTLVSTLLELTPLLAIVGNPAQLMRGFRDSLPKPKWVEGNPNAFHLRRRVYTNDSVRRHDPEANVCLQDLYDSEYDQNRGSQDGSQEGADCSTSSTSEDSVLPANGAPSVTHSTSTNPPQPPTSAPPNPLGPFPNLSSFELGEWFVNRGAQFSVQSLQCLVKLAQRPSFAQDISNANWPRIFRALSEGTEIGHSPSEPVGPTPSQAPTHSPSKQRDTPLPQPDREDEWVDDDGWESTPISISVPLSKSTTSHVTGTLYHRSIVSILREKVLNSSDMRLFHYEPSEVLWQPDPSTRATRIHSELYNSEAFLRTHQELQDSPAPPGCKLQRVVAALMFWSDATHVSSFSDQKLWPGYMAFGNESKYRRCRPSEHLCHNIAYFSDVGRWLRSSNPQLILSQQLPDGLKDLITSKTTGGNIPDKLMHFCKQEMLHAQWKILLDDEEFREAVKNGIVLKCPDNEERRFYIRIFTYSADYQEK